MKTQSKSSEPTTPAISKSSDSVVINIAVRSEG